MIQISLFTKTTLGLHLTLSLILTFFSRKPVLANGVYRDYGAIYNFRCIIDRLGHVDNDLVNATTGEIIGDIMPVYVVSDNMISGAGPKLPITR